MPKQKRSDKLKNKGDKRHKGDNLEVILREDLAQQSGVVQPRAPRAPKQRTRADSADEELVLDDIVLKAGSTLHVYVASNRLRGSCAYDVEAASDEVLDLLPEPTGGFRGLEKPTPQKTSGERVLCVDGGGARGVVPLAILAECERETRVAIRDQFDLREFELRDLHQAVA